MSLQIPLQDIIDDAREYDISAFPHPGGRTLREDSCKFLGALIRRCQLKTVLEFGSGFSSMVIANEIKHSTGHLLVSIENYQYYSRIAQQHLTKHGIKANVNFNTFPLRPRFYHKQMLVIYAIPPGFWSNFGKFDLVLIDGPHHDFGREAVFYEAFHHLRVGGIAIIDDSNRESMEMIYAKKWKKFFGDAIKMTLFKHIGTGLNVITKLKEAPMGCNFSRYEILISYLRTTRNFYRVLTYKDMH